MVNKNGRRQVLHRLRGGQSHKKRYIEYNNCKVIIVIDDNTKVCCIQKHFKSLVPQILSISILSLAIFLGRNIYYFHGNTMMV